MSIQDDVGGLETALLGLIPAYRSSIGNVDDMRVVGNAIEYHYGLYYGLGRQPQVVVDGRKWSYIVGFMQEEFYFTYNNVIKDKV